VKVNDERIAEIRANQAAAREARREATRRKGMALVAAAPSLAFAEPAEYDAAADPIYDRDFHA
jgi:hypothetical protein